MLKRCYLVEKEIRDGRKRRRKLQRRKLHNHGGPSFHYVRYLEDTANEKNYLVTIETGKLFTILSWQL